jgi:hypothetical protein
MTSCPWQLYLFAFTNLALAIPMMSVGIFGGGLCRLMFIGESCDEVERVYSLYVGICALYVFALFYILTFGNKGKAPELKRLAMFATNCTVASFSGVICIGSTAMGGVERQALHIADMIWFFALFMVLVAAMADDSPVAGSRSPLVGLKFINPKALVLLIGIAVLIKMFVLTDFMDLFTFLNFDDDSVVTDLARALESLIAILLFEILFAAVFAVAYGNDKDQENFIYVVLGMTIIGGLSIIPIAEYFRSGLVKQAFVPAVVFFALCIFSLVQSRKDQRDGYETISTVV